MSDGNVTRKVRSQAFCERLNALMTGAHADQLGASTGADAPFDHGWYGDVVAFAGDPVEAAAALMLLSTCVTSLVHTLAEVTGRPDAAIMERMALANLAGATEP